MNMNIKLHGINEQIVQNAIRKGLAKTKTAVLMMGLMELNHRYNLTSVEDPQDITDARRILQGIKTGKQLLISQAEFERRMGKKPND